MKISTSKFRADSVADVADARSAMCSFAPKSTFRLILPIKQVGNLTLVSLLS